MSNTRKPAQPKPKLVKPRTTDRVVLAFIHPGQCSAYFTTSLLGTMLFDQATDRHIVGIINEWSSANVSAARNSLTEKFVDEKDAEWLLWIDSDMSWDHDAVRQLISVADPETAPIVGGLCFGMRDGKLFPTIYQLTKTADGRPTTIRVEDYDDGLAKCAATGAAFLLIHRSVLVAIREKKFNAVFPWFQETELAGLPAGEDLTFCLRAGLCGYPVHVDTRIRVGHHKSQLLTHDLFQLQKEAVASD